MTEPKGTLCKDYFLGGFVTGVIFTVLTLVFLMALGLFDF